MTAVRDWSAVDDMWPARAIAVADLIPPGASVLDLGSGAQGLGRRLHPSCSYTPADLVARTPGTLAFDMVRDVWPAGRWDVAVLSGVLEYSPDASVALQRVRELAPVAIVTYLHRRAGSLNRTALRLAARRAGWSIGLVGSWSIGSETPRHPIYRLVDRTIRPARARGDG